MEQNKPRRCGNCIWSKKFEKRPDEPSNIGCKYPNWEHYITDEGEALGCFTYSKRLAKEANDE